MLLNENNGVINRKEINQFCFLNLYSALLLVTIVFSSCKQSNNSTIQPYEVVSQKAKQVPNKCGLILLDNANNQKAVFKCREKRENTINKEVAIFLNEEGYYKNTTKDYSTSLDLKVAIYNFQKENGYPGFCDGDKLDEIFNIDRKAIEEVYCECLNKMAKLN